MARNPRRRRSVARVRRRAYRRNPSMFGGGLFGNLPALQTVLFTGVGFVGTPIVEGFATRIIPATITGNTFGKYAVRIASVIGVTFLVKTLIGSAEAKPVAVGGGLYVATTAIAEFAPGIVPGLSGFAPGLTPGLGAYARPTGLNAYAAPNRQLRAASSIAPRAATLVPARYRRI